MIVIMGRTASGKTTVVNHLVQYHGFKQILTWTTRPIRPGEKNTYHFTTEPDFLYKIRTDFFLEYKKYDTVFGTWYYGSAKEDFEKADDKTIIILTPSGYLDLLNSIPDISHKSIYLYSDRSTIVKRLRGRGDSDDEAKRRMLADDRDFAEVESLADRVIINNGKKSIEEIAEEIVNFSEEHA